LLGRANGLNDSDGGDEEAENSAKKKKDEEEDDDDVSILQPICCHFVLRVSITQIGLLLRHALYQ